MQFLSDARSSGEKALTKPLFLWIFFALGTAGCVPSMPSVPSETQPRLTSELETQAPTAPLASLEPSSEIVDAVSIAPDAGTTVSSGKESSSIKPLSGLDRLLAIAVCPRQFQVALEPWVQRRRREGIDVVVVESQSTAEALKRSLVASVHRHCHYVLLVGDAQHSANGESSDPDQHVPTLYVDADVTAPYQQAPQLPGDYAYGDFDDDGVIEAAVGRLPVKNSSELAAIIQRIITYEDSDDFGRWRSRVDLVAGLGGFGTIVDGAIEMVAGGIVTGSLPGSVRTRITHAGPTSDFHPGTAEFTPTVLRNYEDGARFWVYAGHGWINELDRVPGNQFGRPVLSMSDLPSLRRSHASSPIALMLACYTGAFDTHEDCLAERMLLANEGPIAILAGSRVTMPYGNAATAIGLINAVYEERAARLGDAWLTALRELSLPSTSNTALQTRRMMIDGIASVLGGGARIDDERCEHRQLYNLFGDPTLRLASDAAIAITKPDDAVSGRPWTIQGTTPIAGELTIEVHRRLGSPVPARTNPQSRYDDANDTVIAARTIAVEPGEWRCEIDEMPGLGARPTLSSPIIIKADLVGTSGFASGSQSSWLRSQAKEPAQSSTSDLDTDASTPTSR